MQKMCKRILLRKFVTFIYILFLITMRKGNTNFLLGKQEIKYWCPYLCGIVMFSLLKLHIVR
jgi:hypothetical protein